MPKLLVNAETGHVGTGRDKLVRLKCRRDKCYRSPFSFYSFWSERGISVAAIAAALLWKGTLYHSIKPEARPRRWVLILLLALFAIFIVWFPVWITWPHALISHFLTLLFGITFVVFGLVSRFPSLIDSYV